MAMAVTPEKRTAEALTYIPLPRFLPTRMLLGVGGGGGQQTCAAAQGHDRGIGFCRLRRRRRRFGFGHCVLCGPSLRPLDHF
jgi:hypothetical protein